MKITKYLSFLMLLFFFYALWFGPQYLSYLDILNDYYTNIVYSTAFLVLGCSITTMIYKSRFNIEYFEKSSKLKIIIGILILLINMLFLIPSGSYEKLMVLKPNLIFVLRYITLFLPMVFGIAIMCFLFIPFLYSSIKNIGIKYILIILSTFLFMLLGFLIDSVFRDFETAIIMAIFGVLFAISQFLTRNFWFTFIGIFFFMIVNTMADNKYNDYPLLLTIPTTLFLIVTLVFMDIVKKKRPTTAST